MTLKKRYMGIKDKKNYDNLAKILGTILGLVILLAVVVGYTYVANLIWNHLAIIFTLPKLSFINFILSLALIRMLVNIITIKLSRK